MLNDPALPPAVVSGLQALYLLLTPSGGRGSPSQRSHRPVTYVNLSHDASASGSDSEESPYTGEKPSLQKKNSRKGVTSGVFRRMSTSTWTTTTSATGMPTLEPKPCRKRTTSFRGVSDLSPSHSPIRNHQLNVRNDEKTRSFSTTALYNNANKKHSTRERQTVCSLHPDGSVDADHLDRVARGLHNRISGNNPYIIRLERLKTLPNQHICEGLADDCTCDTPLNEDIYNRNAKPSDSIARKSPECICELDDRTQSQYESFKKYNKVCDNKPETAPLAPACKRTLRSITSDYESSDSPNSLGASEETPRQRMADLTDVVEEESQLTVIKDEICDNQSKRREGFGRKEVKDSLTVGKNCIVVDDNIIYDLDAIHADSTLNAISEWDYPIFQLEDEAGNQILSRICYKVFSEVGLFETFKIPLDEFLCFFHALEVGYRNVPYHNNIHASDVLHGVYYFTSQPIPGFETLDSEDIADMVCGSPRLTQRQSFTAEDSYGIMGANLPALELMALYTAAAMHDFDHPGRTNAFLVTTNAPEAILYNDRSVLENHHAAAAWSLLLSSPKYNFLKNLDRTEFRRFRYLVIEAILATDLKRHFEILAEFNAKANEPDAPGLDWNSEPDRLLAMEIAIKLADINGPCKALEIHTQWTFRIAEEFYEQGDEEVRLGLPISPYMDRQNPQLSKLQESFINHLVAPLCNAYGEAGLMPGVWQDDPSEGHSADSQSEPEDEEEVEEYDEDGMAIEKTSRTTRKIFCLQTRHLQDNHHYWVAKIREEQRLSGDVIQEGNENATTETVKENSSRADIPKSLQLSSDEPMEPIEEEKTPASQCSSRSFSFEKEESKL